MQAVEFVVDRKESQEHGSVCIRLFEHLQSLRLVTKTDINFGKLGK